MRIMTGKYKGRNIVMPKGIRPTQNKVRKAIFDILGDIEGLSFLELFAGTGAVGIEALSAGAKRVVFVEQDRGCVEKIRQNLSVLQVGDFRVLGLDVFGAIEQLAKSREKFEIIFLDPPYYRDLALRRTLNGVEGVRSVPRMSPVESLAKKTLQLLGACDILAANGFIVAQHFTKDNLPDRQGGLILFKRFKYGDTALSLYKKDVPESDISR